MSFDKYLLDPVLDHWNGFPEFMEQLGFVMDMGESFKSYSADCGLHMKKPATPREEKRNNLYLLEHADRQIVGNYLFSYWRYLTHWAGPYSEYEVD